MIPDHIKNIIFDLGGVIVTLDQPRTDAALAHLGGMSGEEFRRVAAENIHLFQAIERGELSNEAFLEGLRKLLGADVTKEALVEAWNEMLVDLPAANLKTLERLGKDYRLFMLSNTNDIHIEQVHKMVKERSGLEDFSSLFEMPYYSQRIGARKPEPESYKHILLTHGLEPGETLFIDDNAENIQGAQALGIQTWHYPLNLLLEEALNGRK